MQPPLFWAKVAESTGKMDNCVQNRWGLNFNFHLPPDSSVISGPVFHLLSMSVSFLSCDYLAQGLVVVLSYMGNGLCYSAETKSKKTLYECIYSEYFIFCWLETDFKLLREETVFSPCFHAESVRMRFKSQVRCLSATAEWYSNKNQTLIAWEMCLLS